MLNYEPFTWRNEQWTRFPAPNADEAFIMAVDLGQSQDPTAIAVMRHHTMPLETWRVDEKKHTTRQDIEQHYDVQYAERMALGTSYPAIIQHVRDLLNRPPLRDNCYLVIDEFGRRPSGR